MSIRSRLVALERCARRRGCGPGCPPQILVHYTQDGPDAEPVLVEGQKPPTPCPRCGRPAEVTPMVLCWDPNFYGNADRLKELTTGSPG
jgi:hypothetical protein